MTITEYRQVTTRTLPDLGEGLKAIQTISSSDLTYLQIIGDKLNLSHMALGLASELGELANCVGTELKMKVDKVNLLEELGDIYWYVSNYSNLRNIPLPENVKIVIEKDLALDLMITSIADLVDLIKRFIAYNKDIEKAKELEIIYNIMCALKMFEEIYDLSGDEIRERNILKLKKRYPDRFSDILAINRDTIAERVILENKDLPTQ